MKNKSFLLGSQFLICQWGMGKMSNANKYLVISYCPQVTVAACEDHGL